MTNPAIPAILPKLPTRVPIEPLVVPNDVPSVPRVEIMPPTPDVIFPKTMSCMLPLIVHPLYINGMDIHGTR